MLAVLGICIWRLSRMKADIGRYLTRISGHLDQTNRDASPCSRCRLWWRASRGRSFGTMNPSATRCWTGGTVRRSGRDRRRRRARRNWAKTLFRHGIPGPVLYCLYQHRPGAGYGPVRPVLCGQHPPEGDRRGIRPQPPRRDDGLHRQRRGGGAGHPGQREGADHRPGGDHPEDWVGATSGILRKYGSDRFMVLLEERHLEQMVAGRFDILDRVRSIQTRREDQRDPVHRRGTGGNPAGIRSDGQTGHRNGARPRRRPGGGQNQKRLRFLRRRLQRGGKNAPRCAPAWSPRLCRN